MPPINPDLIKKYTNQQLQDWFIGKATTAAGIRTRIITKSPNRERGSVVIGKMFFFIYDPKHKKTLPIYDKFPLVFPIEPYSDGFLGLNFHYLDFATRKKLLNKLTEYKTSAKYTAQTRLKLSYDLLSSTIALSTIARPCIKRYLFSHVRSNFIEVTADEWDRALELPVDNFVIKG